MVSLRGPQAASFLPAQTMTTAKQARPTANTICVSILDHPAFFRAGVNTDHA